MFGTASASAFIGEALSPVPILRSSNPVGRVRAREFDAELHSEDPVMNGATTDRPTSWSLTRVDVLLCVLPIALFLSIVSLV